MWKRVVAAVAAVVLAAVGVILVVSYANNADERALEGMQTQKVLVALESAPQGTPAEELGDKVELQDIPGTFVVEGALADLNDVQGKVLAAALTAGQQVHESGFSTPEALRAAGEAPLPEEAADLHQVTVALPKPRAVGGNLAIGDRVGVFMSFTVDGQEGATLQSDGSVVLRPSDQDETLESEGEAGDITISTTHLTLHKVVVTDVEGGYVGVPANADDGENEPQRAEQTVFVTVALAAPDAEKLVYAMEFGQVWLSLEPETADEDGTGPVVVTIPDTARDVLQ